MKQSAAKSKSLYVIKSIYVREKRTFRVVEKLGMVAELRDKLNGHAWLFMLPMLDARTLQSIPSIKTLLTMKNDMIDFMRLLPI